MAERIKIQMPDGPKLRVSLIPTGTKPVSQSENRNLRRGFLAGWIRLGFEIAERFPSGDVVDFSRWTRNEFGYSIQYKDGTTDKEFLAQLRDLQQKFIDGWSVAENDDEDTEPEETEDTDDDEDDEGDAEDTGNLALKTAKARLHR